MKRRLIEMIYFDNSATSPIDEEVVDVMLPYLREEYGNKNIYHMNLTLE